MRTRRYLIAAFAVSAAVSCVKENIKESQPSQAEGLMEKTFEAYAPTRTALGADRMSVIWSENDGINVFDETSAKYEAFSVTTAGEASTRFKGMADASATDFYALYPYNADATWDYDTRTLTSYLTHKQKGIAGGFDASAALSVASATDGVLNFKNVGALMRFTVSSSDVKEIIIKANNAEKLAGAVTVKFDGDGQPSIDTEALGTMWHKVQLLPAVGDVFAPGVYNIVVLPCTLTDGLTVNVTKSDNKVYSKFKKDEAVIGQGRVFELGVIDSGLTYDRDKFKATFSSTVGIATMVYTNTHFGLIRNIADVTSIDESTTSISEAKYWLIQRTKNSHSDADKGGYDVEGVNDETKVSTDVNVFYKNMSDVSLLTMHLFTYGMSPKGSGKVPYMTKCAEIIADWANACKDVDYPNNCEITAKLVRACYPFFVAFEALYNQTAWITGDQQTPIISWFRNIVDEIKQSMALWQSDGGYGSEYFQNMAVTHMWGLLSIGYALEDAELVEFALDHIDNPCDFYDCLQRSILMEGDSPHPEDPNAVAPQTGEIMDRYRHSSGLGLRSASLTLQMLSTAARTMRNNGLNLYEYTCPTGENLCLAYEFYAPFYEKSSASEQGGYYAGEKNVGLTAEDLIGLYELGYNAYPSSIAIKSVIDAIPNRGSNGNDGTLRQMHQQLGYTRLLSIDVDTTN